MLKNKDLKEIQALINMGKQRGYVTYEEMNNVLPTHLIGTNQLDDVMIMFSNLDIEVVNNLKKRAAAAARSRSHAGLRERRARRQHPRGGPAKR